MHYDLLIGSKHLIALLTVGSRGNILVWELHPGKGDSRWD
jgi:hypothetical protein